MSLKPSLLWLAVGPDSVFLSSLCSFFVLNEVSLLHCKSVWDLLSFLSENPEAPGPDSDPGNSSTRNFGLTEVPVAHQVLSPRATSLPFFSGPASAQLGTQRPCMSPRKSACTVICTHGREEIFVFNPARSGVPYSRSLLKLEAHRLFQSLWKCLRPGEPKKKIGFTQTKPQGWTTPMLN